MPRPALAAVVPCLLALAGCGSEPEDPLIEKAGAICTVAERAAGAVPPPASFDDPEGTATYFSAMVPITEREQAGLAALDPEGAAGEEFRAFVTAQAAVVDLLHVVRTKSRRGQDTAAELERLTPLGKRFAAAAAAAGVDDCAS